MLRVIISSLLVFGLITGGCGRSHTGSRVEVSGSTVLLPLARDAAAKFTAVNPGIKVNVSGGGSFTGLQQVAYGVVDIGVSDVEPPKGDSKYKGLVDHVVVLSSFALIIHRDAGVDNLTREQAVGVFTGRITNWRDVGGKDEDITVFNRPKSSGSRQVIKDLVLKGQEFTGSALTVNSNAEMREAVATTPGAIGFVATADLDDTVKALKYDSVACSRENIVNGTYPLRVPGHMYTKGEPREAVKAYIDFVRGDSFSGEIRRMGFFLPSEVKNQI
ncbi:MAG: phosphate ABC transporter substrate-binding protein [Bacillota bacterium]